MSNNINWGKIYESTAWGSGVSDNSISWGKSYADLAGGGGGDADAQAFITAASITDSTQQSAIDTLVTDLKTAGVWTKMKAIYPIVGGTASSHKFNLKDPRDLDAAFRLTFTSGWTHSSNGMSPTNAAANTKISPSAELSTSSAHISTYINTTPNNGVLMGNGFLSCFFQFADNTYYGSLASTTYMFSSLTNSSGYCLVNRQSSSLQKLIKDNTLITSNTQSGSSYDSANIAIGAYRINASSPSNARVAFSSIGDGLTDTEASDLYTAVQAFQTTLGRQV